MEIGLDEWKAYLARLHGWLLIDSSDSYTASVRPQQPHQLYTAEAVRIVACPAPVAAMDVASNAAFTTSGALVETVDSQ